MALVTEVRLQSCKLQSKHEVAHGKKNRKNKRQRLADDENEPQDACADLYEAAQAQLEQEMKAAGMEGSLPMSFGGGSREKSSRKRKREVQEEEEEDPVEEKDREAQEEGVEAEEKEDGGGEGKPVNEEETPKTETTIVDKVRVVYDSEGEVAERVVEKVEVVTEEKPEEHSIREIQHKNSDVAAGKKKKKAKTKYPVPKDVVKFYLQRHVLFEKFEDGIQLDHESWYSVTPQAISEHIAKRLSCDIVVDPFAGCGGNVIQLAMTCKQVIAIDIDPEKIRMAKHNATIYGVADKIEWIVGNSIDILPKLKADAVFLSPPWGGVKYSRKHFSLEDMVVKGVSGLDLFAKAQQVSKNIAYYLPRGTPTIDLEALTPDEPVECEKIFLNKQLKVVTAYYGDLVASKTTNQADKTADP